MTRKPEEWKPYQVRWQPQYRDGEIVRYLVYAWIGHPLLGKVQGSEHIVATKGQAQRLATEMRKNGR